MSITVTTEQTVVLRKFLDSYNEYVESQKRNIEALKSVQESVRTLTCFFPSFQGMSLRDIAATAQNYLGMR